MHQYAIDSEERTAVPFYLAGLAVLAAWGLHVMMALTNVVLPWWADAPAPIALYGALYRLFDQWAWRWPAIRRLGIVQTPDLRGAWAGLIVSSFDQHHAQYAATLTIAQTWTKICIELRASASRSSSHIAGIANVRGSQPVLSYEYLNEPDAAAVGSMQMHRGTAWLQLHERPASQVSGEYYTGRGRQTFGRMEFHRA